MDTYSSKREIEKPKRTKKEIETMMRLEARSHANACVELARSLQHFSGQHGPVVEALEKAAQFIRQLAE